MDALRAKLAKLKENQNPSAAANLKDEASAAVSQKAAGDAAERSPRYLSKLQRMQSLAEHSPNSPALLQQWVALLDEIRAENVGPCHHVWQAYSSARKALPLSVHGDDERTVQLYVEYARLQM